ncbi:MAG: structural hemagglutinin/hemolysin toxin protein RtxA [Methylophagaceae bacterium]|jgi:structural hemagglutinin/hemolysin toxin protein RtxA
MAAQGLSHYKLVFFVPNSHKERVKDALFAQGAGQYGGYECCAWETLGQGQFRPLHGSQPFIGQSNKIEKVAEYRVEMLCQSQHIKAILQTLVDCHPYEVPAYEVWSVKSLDDF